MVVQAALCQDARHPMRLLRFSAAAKGTVLSSCTSLGGAITHVTRGLTRHHLRRASLVRPVSRSVLRAAARYKGIHTVID